MSSETPRQQKPSSTALVERLFRSAAGDLVGKLVGRFGTGSLEPAEDAVQEAMLAALRRWVTNGIPENPLGWLYTVARNRLLDNLRRGARRTDLDTIAELADEKESIGPTPDRLDLLLTICRGSISTPGAVALSLKVVFGFGVREIAGLLGLRPKTVELRLYRARARLRGQDLVPASGRPPSATERAAVLNAVYVAFAEGFSRPLDPSPIAVDLATEAISLVEALIARPAWAGPDARALLALFYLQGSRLAARADDADFVPLADQDRSLWRSDWIREGLRQMKAAMVGDRLSRYHLELAVAACYASTVDNSEPPWEQILSLYDELLDRFPSPFARLSRAIVVGQSRGPASGIAALDELAEEPAVRRNPYYHSARAVFLERLHLPEQALAALEALQNCARGPSELAFAQRRIAASVATVLHSPAMDETRR